MAKTEVRPRTKRELAQLYNVSIKTISKWLSKIGMNHNCKNDGYLYNNNEIKIIFEKLGEP